jgi:hypothetical protein
MRLVILAATVTLVTGTAMADGSIQTSIKRAHHYRDANASISEDSAPADILSNAH